MPHPQKKDCTMTPFEPNLSSLAVAREILLRARAIENQCYVLAAAQGGTHPNGRRTWGHSMLIDPWGAVKSVLAEGEGVVAGEIDAAFTEGVRQSLPALKHRTM